MTELTIPSFYDAPRLQEQDGEDDVVTCGKVAVIEALRPITTGKRLLIVGGFPDNRTMAEVKMTLGFADVEWEQSPRGASPRRVTSMIPRFDYVLVMVMMISHSKAPRIREVAKANNVEIVNCNSSGVLGIVNAFHKDLTIWGAPEPKKNEPDLVVSRVRKTSEKQLAQLERARDARLAKIRARQSQEPAEPEPVTAVPEPSPEPAEPAAITGLDMVSVLSALKDEEVWVDQEMEAAEYALLEAEDAMHAAQKRQEACLAQKGRLDRKLAACRAMIDAFDLEEGV